VRSIPNARQGRASWREGLTAKARAKRQSVCHDDALAGWRLGRNLLTDCPQEGSKLAGDRRRRNRGLLAIGNEPAVAGAQPDLCLPGDAADVEREILEPAPQGLADPCRKSVSPRSLDQHPSCSTVAGLRNGAAPHRVPGCAFRRNEAEKSHQLLRGCKATYIANLRNKGDRDKKRHTPQGLVGCHHRRHCPRRHDLAHLLLQSRQANLCRVDRWCAAVIGNNALADFATAPQWYDDGEPDYVTQTDPTDQDADSIECGMAFLSWLMSQGHSLSQIAQEMVSLGDSGTLAQLYANLTSDSASNALPAFLAAVGKLSGGVTNDDPFGGAAQPAQMAHIAPWTMSANACARQAMLNRTHRAGVASAQACWAF
jgi:hypothetical protein